MQLVDTKSILAKLMATENLTVEQRKVPTASFDVKNRVLTLPILDKNISNDVYDLFIGHEVGHALYTPIEEMKFALEEGRVNMSVVNIVEDSRIERKIKNRYPGLRNSFNRAYKELNEKNFFGTEGNDINSYNLIDRINLHCKVGAHQAIYFTDEERELLKEVESTETYTEVIEVSKKLTALMVQQEMENQRIVVLSNDSSEQEKEDETEEYEPQENDIIVHADSENIEQEQQKESKAIDSSETDTDDDTKESTKQSTQEGSANNEGIDKPLKDKELEMSEEEIRSKISSLTDATFKRNEHRLIETDNIEYVYGNIPKIDLKKAIFDYKDFYAKLKETGEYTNIPGFVKLRRETDKVVSYLVKEFEMRKNADQMKRASTAKTGDLNVNKLYSYKFSEDIFKKITVLPGGKSHGLVMFIDWSGSMHKHIHDTFKQLVSLVMFCKKVNIPYEVYAFASNEDYAFGYEGKRVENDIVVRGFKLFNLFSNRMTAAEFAHAGAVMHGLSLKPAYAPRWMAMQSTPLNESMVVAMDLIPEFQKKYKLQNVNAIFLTDGGGDSMRSLWKKEKVGWVTTTAYSFRDSVKQITILNDPVTKHQVKMNGNDSKNQTEAYVKLLKRRTGCNILGFYILSSREFTSTVGYMFPESNIDSLKETFRKNNSAVLTNAGFDEYYFLRSGTLDNDDDELEINVGASVRKMVNEFSKYTGARVSNRVILNRFIGMIA